MIDGEMVTPTSWEGDAVSEATPGSDRTFVLGMPQVSYLGPVTQSLIGGITQVTINQW